MDTPSPPRSFFRALLPALLRAITRLAETFVPADCRRDPDVARRALLIAHFGIQGTFFGAAYALFYYKIGHLHGAEVILVCSAIFAGMPWLLRFSERLDLAGHLLAGTMATGFTTLSLMEGGIHSHAIVWLASVPLCALLILGIWPATFWAAVCFLAGTSISVATFLGFEFKSIYDPRWHNGVDAAGNLGIILFLFALGLVFETSRAAAFNRMQASLDAHVASNQQLAHLNNEKTEFLGIAAHDLRNPLTAVIGYSDLLSLDTTPKVARMGRSIGKAGRRMLELITDLLDANAIEAGQYAAQIEAHDLRALVVISAQNHYAAAERKQIILDVDEGPDCWAKADRKATIQILDNLVSNALKYSPPGSRVLLSLNTDAHWSGIAIQDEGPGITREDQQKLFLKHTRLSARPTGGESSYGLGLSIVKRLAETMGGSVHCESEPGNGATFILRLPSVPAPSSAPPVATF
ncbi:MAG: signal transduction histidine kinase [Chthoniobacteraceae bacterium]|nr:signal transduction histidine kinase [Chthoniobacteraceae bacterium]